MGNGIYEEDRNPEKWGTTSIYSHDMLHGIETLPC